MSKIVITQNKAFNKTKPKLIFLWICMAAIVYFCYSFALHDKHFERAIFVISLISAWPIVASGITTKTKMVAFTVAFMLSGLLYINRTDLQTARYKTAVDRGNVEDLAQLMASRIPCSDEAWQYILCHATTEQRDALQSDLQINN